MDHPSDQLIHDLIAHPRAATIEEIRLITERIANAPFSTEIQKVRATERGFTVGGLTLGPTANSLMLHFIHHVIMEKQWAMDTTVDEYVQSLHQGARDPEASIALYRHWGARDVAAVITLTERVLQPGRIGPNALPNLIVVYRADRGMIVSGYQFSAMDQIHLPSDAQWLRQQP